MTARLGLTATFIHDGWFWLELTSGNDLVLAAGESHIDDGERTTSMITQWIESEELPPRHRSSGWTSERTARYRDALVVPLVAPPTPLSGSIRSELQEHVDRLEAFALADATRDRTRAAELATGLPPALRDTFQHYQGCAVDRIADGAYLPTLRHYLTDLRSKVSVEDQSYYRDYESGIGRILDQERYLLLAEDDEARSLYASICDEAASLYQWYMNLAKGGLVTAR